MPAEAMGSTEPAIGPALLPARVATALDSLTVPGRPEYVAQARQFVASTIGDWHPHADVAVLLTSEIVTNAVVHSRSRLPGGAVTIDIATTQDGLLIAVTDNGCDDGAPAIRDSPGGEDGNGLVLVANLASAWGFRRRPDRTAVWFTLLKPGASPGAASTDAPESPRSRTLRAAGAQ